MTPEEGNLIKELFNRLYTLENARRDGEAEALIREGLQYAPNAPYALVQTVLVQDEALKRAEARIRALEGGAAEPPRDGGFLGGMRDSLLGRREGRGSVPSVQPGEAPPGMPPTGMSPAWQAGAPPMPGGYAPGPAQGGYAPGQPPTGSGGSFLGTAAAAAAGVIGGSLLLGGIRSMMGQQSGGARAAYEPPAGGSGASPWSGGGSGGDLARQAGLDDIGRGPAGAGGGSRGFGLLDDSRSDDSAADADADDHQDDGGDEGDLSDEGDLGDDFDAVGDEE